ncbi:hypothetical protein IAU60_006535 [Kwoniella sp. DSM 27419]
MTIQAKETSSLLDELRAQSQVDCDTLDAKVAEALGPFVDHTSNQAIAFGELQKPENAGLIEQSLELTERLHGKHPEVTFEQLATEVMMVMLSAKMTPHITGFAHIQTNPYYSYSASDTIRNAERIIAIYSAVLPDFPSKRICIKIPSTWEGLQACRHLEANGVHTLATTLFSMEQVALAADAGCTYIAPYVNELQVHFVPGFVDNDKGFDLCRAAQQYYTKIDASTQVLPASLISIAEVMKLAGVHHITVSPPLLAELASTSGALASATTDTIAPSFKVNSEEGSFDTKALNELVKDESRWRMAYTRSKNGENDRKLSSAINIFANMQDGMEELVEQARQ